MYDSILLSTDGSEGTAAAISEAISLAETFDATIHALFVVDERDEMTSYDMVVENLEREAEAALDAVGRDAEAAGVPVEKHLRRGVPSEEIVDGAEAYGADLIVMGTHGRTGVDRFLHAGSTTERVVRRAPLPVLTAPLHAGLD